MSEIVSMRAAKPTLSQRIHGRAREPVTVGACIDACGRFEVERVPVGSANRPHQQFGLTKVTLKLRGDVPRSFNGAL